MRVGFASVELDPPDGLRLDGYAAREGRSSGVLDPLVGRAYYLESDAYRLAIVLMDVLGVSEDYVGEVRRRLRTLAEGDDLPLMVAATHTHSAPAGFATYPRADPAEVAFADRTAGRVARAVVAAKGAARTVLTRTASVPLHGVAASRLDPARPIESVASVTAHFDAASQELVGVHANVPCHPTVLGSGNLSYSGDLFGYAARGLERSLGRPCLLSNGASAEVSTRFVRRAQTAAEAERLGSLLAEALHEGVRSLGRAVPPRGGELRIVDTAVTVPVRAMPPRAEIEADVEEARMALGRGESEALPAGHMRVLRTRLEGATALAELAKEDLPPEVHLELFAVATGDVVLVFVPGEVFHSSFRAWTRAFPRGRPWRVVSLANGYAGYFPSEQAVREGTYEARCSRFDARATRQVGTAVGHLLERLSMVG